MFGSLGTPEILAIFVLALIVFGPKKLPEIGRSVGRAIREFKQASQDVVNTLSIDMDPTSSSSSGYRYDPFEPYSPPAQAAPYDNYDSSFTGYQADDTGETEQFYDTVSGVTQADAQDTRKVRSVRKVGLSGSRAAAMRTRKRSR